MITLTDHHGHPATGASAYTARTWAEIPEEVP